MGEKGAQRTIKKKGIFIIEKRANKGEKRVKKNLLRLIGNIMKLRAIKRSNRLFSIKSLKGQNKSMFLNK